MEKGKLIIKNFKYENNITVDIVNHINNINYFNTQLLVPKKGTTDFNIKIIKINEKINIRIFSNNDLLETNTFVLNENS